MSGNPRWIYAADGSAREPRRDWAEVLTGLPAPQPDGVGASAHETLSTGTGGMGQAHRLSLAVPGACGEGFDRPATNTVHRL